MPHHLLILNWHNIDQSWCFPAPRGAARAGFAAQLRWLARWTNVVELDAAVSDLFSGPPLPPRAVALTFDDGYRDALTAGVPLLQQLGLPATFFLVPDVLDEVVHPWWERLGWAFAHCSLAALGHVDSPGGAERQAVYQQACTELKRRDEADRRDAVDALIERLGVSPPSRPVAFLDWDDARGLVRQGFSVGSHSRDHAILARETSDKQVTNLAAARDVLQQQLGVPVRGLAYPNGTVEDYGPATVAAARRAGHSYAVTTRGGWNRSATPPFELQRMVLYPERGRAGLGVLARSAVDGLGSRYFARASA
jgi:peptidoglycan/xylan/chitin deacetylase (PgdA/CDA1 family)